MFGVLCLALAAAVVLWDRWRLARTFRKLDGMLDAALQGTFREERFDESRQSALESKLAQYLAAAGLTAQSAREEKEKIKALISDISHQTKTPIANVRLYTQLLEEAAPDCAAYTSALDAQARKLQTLVEALVKTSRLETGILALFPQPGDLAPLLEEAAAQFAPQAEEKGLTLALEAGETPAVFDAKWTAEALCNLLDNAVKYTPPGGRVTLRAFSYELFSRVDVEDDGPGIPEAEAPHIFQRFYRGSGAREAEGVGIGLYLTRQIAEGQGGWLKVFSRKGQGTKFSLYLPRE